VENKNHLTMKTLQKKIFITGKIKTLTGLHIGGHNTHLDIGGVDNFVIKNPNNSEPYLPGSSLKGKIRSLLEQSYGNFGDIKVGDLRHGPIDDPNHPITKVFGSVKGKNIDKNIPARIIVRDGAITSEDNDNTDLPYTEVKTEIIVDRITAAASPRQIERVPADSEFKLDIVLNIWSNADDFQELPEVQIVQMLFNGMRLLEGDYLGGNGSRGSGQVKIGIEKIQERDNKFYCNTESDNAEYLTSEHQIPEDLKLWA